MSEEIKELLKELKDSIDYPRIIVPSYDGSDDEEIQNDKCFTPKDCKILLDYIEQLKKELAVLRMSEEEWLEETIGREDYE